MSPIRALVRAKSSLEREKTYSRCNEILPDSHGDGLFTTNLCSHATSCESEDLGMGITYISALSGEVGVRLVRKSSWRRAEAQASDGSIT